MYHKQITSRYNEITPETYTQLHDMITQTIKETVEIFKKEITKKSKTLRQITKKNRMTCKKHEKQWNESNDQTQKTPQEYIMAHKELRECTEESEMEKHT